MVKAFCQGLSMGMKNGSIALECKQKDNQWNGIIHLLLQRSNLGLPLQQRRS
jgi:hypothetical protein